MGQKMLANVKATLIIFAITSVDFHIEPAGDEMWKYRQPFDIQRFFYMDLASKFRKCHSLTIPRYTYVMLLHWFQEIHCVKNRRIEALDIQNRCKLKSINVKL